MAAASDSGSRKIEMAERGDWGGGVKMQHNPLKLEVATHCQLNAKKTEVVDIKEMVVVL